MRVLTIILFFGFTACGQHDSLKKIVVDPRAKKLNDSAIFIAMHKQDFETALSLLDEATKIDSTYITAYTNILSFSLELKQYDRALNTVLKLRKLKPEIAEYYFTTGLVYELKGDSLASRSQYIEAAARYDKILDTMSSKNENLDMLLMNKAINLIFLGEQEKGNEILEQLYNKSTDRTYKEFLSIYKNKSKQEIIKAWLDPGIVESSPIQK